MSHAPQPRAGRRTAGRRSQLNATTVLAVVLPLLSLGALLLVRPAEPADSTRPPTETALTSATLVCPPALPGSAEVSLSTVAEGVDGQVQVGLGEKSSAADLASGRVTTVDQDSAAVISGEDETAPGLVAGRSGGSEQAVTSCGPPQADVWFTGVGAGPAHSSVVELTNPDAGTAIADIIVHGSDGVVEVPRLRGVSVPGGSSVSLDLAAIVPRTDDLALEVVSERGRIGTSLLDRVDQIGSAPLSQDWLPSQAEPSRDNVLLGLAPGSGVRRLVIANPGTDEVRSEVKVVGPESVFAPEGVDEIRVPPRSVVRVTLTSVLAAVAKDDLGLEVTSSGPVTATLRSVVGNDLSHAVPGTRFSAPATVLVPEAPTKGAKKATRDVVLAGASTAGTVTVVSLAADGTEIGHEEVEVTPDRGVVVPVSPAARQVRVVPDRTTVIGAVITSSKDGTAVLPLTVPVSSGLVPDVRPGLP